MFVVYPACFFKEEKNYSVVFPDLNWLSTCGDSLDEAMEAAVDCLAGYIFIGKKQGENFPPASDMNCIDCNKIANELEISASDAFVSAVSVDVDAYAKTHFERSVKKTLTIPAWLNKLATEQNINFSQVLQEALMKKMKLR